MIDRSRWLRPGVRLAVAAIGTVATSASVAQSSDRTPGSPEVRHLQAVEITATGNQEDSGQVAGKRVVQREELLRYGDASIVDSLARIPGISVGRDRRREVEVRLRGLGTGYTLLLVDGERLPVGFSVESLSPDLIERIEISTVGRVDSGQGIAGTINIVLRKRAPRASKELRVTLYGDDWPSTTVGYTVADKVEALSYTVPVSLRLEHNKQASTTAYELREGNVAQRRVTDQRAEQRVFELSTAPRASWSLKGNDKLVGDALFLASGQRRSATDSPVDTTPGYAGSVASSSSGDIDRFLLRTNGNLVVFPSEDGDKVDVRLGGTVARRVSDVALESRDLDGIPVVRQSNRYPSLDSTVNLVSRYSVPFREEHQLATGLEVNVARRREQASNVDELTNQRTDLDETSKSVRAALYLQDEFAMSRDLYLYMGLRAEVVEISTSSASNKSRLLSPVIQLSYKSAARGEAMSSSLSRAHKLPPMSELSSRRYYSALNSPATPDAEGNPFLRPESAWILETSFEKQLGANSSAGITFSKRRIQDVMLTSTSLAGGRWVARLDNRGDAETSTFDLNLRGRLSGEATKDTLDATSTFSWSRSRVESVSRPDNRIDQQVPFAATLRLEYRAAASKTSVELAFNYQAGGLYRISDEQLNSSGTKKSLDVSMSRQVSTVLTVRASVSNLFRSHTTASSVVESSQQSISDRTTTAGVRIFRLAIERKL